MEQIIADENYDPEINLFSMGEEKDTLDKEVNSDSLYDYSNEIQANKYDLALQNQESGAIKTKWIDNTLKLNFSDSFGGSDSVKAARFKLIINVIKGYKDSREVTKVTIFKRQMIKQDFLQGWKVVPTDRIQEKTILYRIARSIIIDNKLRRLDEIKQRIEEQNSNI